MQIFIPAHEKNNKNGINRLHFYVYTRTLSYWWCCCCYCCCFDHGTATTTIITASHSCDSRLDIVASWALCLLVTDILAKGHSAPMTILGTKPMTVPQCQLASPVLQFRTSKGIQINHVQFLVGTRLATAVVVLVGFEGLYRFVLVPNGPSTATIGSSGVCVIASWGVRHRVLDSWGTASKELPVLVLG
jgi:hypothetical protein